MSLNSSVAYNYIAYQLIDVHVQRLSLGTLMWVDSHKTLNTPNTPSPVPPTPPTPHPQYFAHHRNAE